jgi:hypothetical protein
VTRCAGPNSAAGNSVCRATDPGDAEGATLVGDAMGTAPELHLSAGRWARATRSGGAGTLVWTAAAGPDAPVVLGVARAGGAYALTRREPGPRGRVRARSGRGTTR